MPERRLAIALDEIERVEIDCMSCHETIPLPAMKTEAARRLALQTCPWCRNSAALEEDRDTVMALAGALAELRRRSVGEPRGHRPAVKVRLICPDRS